MTATSSSSKELKPEQHFTEPPPRYNEASLVKELEEQGIGRPSTYASIINTIQDREYVAENGWPQWPLRIPLKSARWSPVCW